MKFFKYSLIAALALSGALCACDDDNDYAPGAAVSGDEVYFPISESASIDIPNEALSVPVTVSRIKAENAISVNVSGTVVDSEGADASSVFTLPSQVSFAAGDKESSLDIAVDFAKVVPDEEYTVSLKLEGDNTTPYGASERTYTLVYAPWSEWEPVKGEIGVYTMSVYTSAVEDVPVLYRKSLVNPNREDYAVCDLFYANKDGSPYINFIYSLDKTKTIKVGEVDCPIVTMTTLNCGENGAGSGNYLMLYDLRTWYVEIIGVPESQVDAYMEEHGEAQSYYNPETGTFVMNLILIGTKIPVGNYYSDGLDYLQLPGYKHYEVAFDYNGNYTDPNTDIEYAIVDAYKSEDVNSFVYKYYPGELASDDIDAAIEEIKADEDLEAISEGSSKLALPLDEDGTYTIVAVGRDENGDQVCTSNYSFKYYTSATSAQWKTLGYCEYTDVLLPAFFSSIKATKLDVKIQESVTVSGRYRLVNPYKEYAEDLGFAYMNGNSYMIVDASNPDQVFIEESYLGLVYDPKYGELVGSSLAFDGLAQGYPASAIAGIGWFGKLEDNKITFPAGTLLAGMVNLGMNYANTDPENPTGPTDDDPEAEFDPFYGKGEFAIDLSGLEEDEPETASVKRALSVNSGAATMNGIKPFSSNFKLHTSKKAELKTVDSKTLNEYRLANPRQYRF